MLVAAQTYCGGSVDGAASLANGKTDIAFNWSGKLLVDGWRKGAAAAG
jgi:hypothetical protein